MLGVFWDIREGVPLVEEKGGGALQRISRRILHANLIAALLDIYSLAANIDQQEIGYTYRIEADKLPRFCILAPLALKQSQVLANKSIVPSAAAQPGIRGVKNLVMKCHQPGARSASFTGWMQGNPMKLNEAREAMSGRKTCACLFSEIALINVTGQLLHHLSSSTT